MSRSSDERTKRKWLARRGLKLVCGECGADVIPKGGETYGELTIYFGQCSCGAVVQGMIGPESMVKEAQAFTAGYAAALGNDPPVSEYRPLPKGW